MPAHIARLLNYVAAKRKSDNQNQKYNQKYSYFCKFQKKTVPLCRNWEIWFSTLEFLKLFKLINV